MSRYLSFVFLLLLVVVSADGATCTREHIDTGSGCFVFQDWQGRPLPIWYHVPESTGKPQQVVFVMHGVLRNAADYRDNWRAAADEHGLVILAPEFSRDDFPGAAAYNLGGIVSDPGGASQQKGRALDAIEPVFAAVREDLPTAGTAPASYFIFGHSAGAQFVHRYVLFGDAPNMAAAIAANSGWYTMPDTGIFFPYGLRGTDAGEAALRRAFARPLVIALGLLDNDPQAPYLRTSAGANAQGPHRLARGRAFYGHASGHAKTMGVPFNWRLVHVADAGHDNAAMVDAALKVLATYEEPQ